MKPVYFIMGVSGAGKTTIGKLLAAKTGLPFYDADDFHPESNKAKMQGGIPLSDDDRKPWLKNLNTLALQLQQTTGSIIACSALKHDYRAMLGEHVRDARWVLLHGSFELIEQRIKERQDHYMPAALLQSQFEILEEPRDALRLDVKAEPGELVLSILKHWSDQLQLGIIGLGVMGASLARNAAAKGVALCLYNRRVEGAEEDVAAKLVAAHAELSKAKPFEDLHAFVQSLHTPRLILIMVKAGAAVDAVVQRLLPLLGENDILIDGGNSHYTDTERRIVLCNERGFHFVGAGISGGEEGALTGPSIMPGGNADAVSRCLPLLQTLAAKNKWNKPCCGYNGKGGSGHFAKMVHNGIEYAEMQLLAETYLVLKYGMHLANDEIRQVFLNWHNGDAKSYLLEITIDILAKKEGGRFLLDLIEPVAVSKGTGSWCVRAAAELGEPATLLTTALYARYQSALFSISEMHNASSSKTNLPADALHAAYLTARKINHQQGIGLLSAAAIQLHYHYNMAELLSSWCNGCIIRSALMEQLAEQYANGEPDLKEQLKAENTGYLKSVVLFTIQANLATPAYAAALQYLLSMQGAANGMQLVQAQRDYFGAHGYVRKDDDKKTAVHTKWQPA